MKKLFIPIIVFLVTLSTTLFANAAGQYMSSIPSTEANPYYPISDGSTFIGDNIISLPKYIPYFRGDVYAIKKHTQNDQILYFIEPIVSKFFQPFGPVSSDNEYGFGDVSYSAETNSITQTEGANIESEIKYGIVMFTDTYDLASIDMLFNDNNSSGGLNEYINHFDGVFYTTTSRGLYIPLVNTNSRHTFVLKGTAYGISSGTVVSYEVDETGTSSGSDIYLNDILRNITSCETNKFIGNITIISRYVGTTGQPFRFYYELGGMTIDNGVVSTQIPETSLISKIDTAIDNYLSGGSTPSGTLTVNSAGTHNVSGYQYINVDIPPYSLYFNGDISNGTYEHSTKWNGVDISILMDIGNTFERGSTLTIDENGRYNVGSYDYVQVDASDVIIESSNMFQWLGDAAESFLTFEIAPNFSIGGILLFVLGFSLIFWILKIFLGG